MKTKLKITGEHISTDGKNKCIHYSDGVVVKEELSREDKIGTRKKDFTSMVSQGNWVKVHKLDK